jgi:hypothetical protein
VLVSCASANTPFDCMPVAVEGMYCKAGTARMLTSFICVCCAQCHTGSLDADAVAAAADELAKLCATTEVMQ